MKFLLCLVAFLALASTGRCDPPLPSQAVQAKVPSGLEGLVWNKWDTEHFVVISLDKSRGSSMRHEVESVRSDVMARWSMPDSQFKGCKLVMVPDASMLKKLFGLSEPKCEVNISASGTSASIWIDEERISLLPSLIAECELATGKFKTFVRRGVPILERSPARIREDLLASADLDIAAVLDDSGKPRDPSAAARASVVLCLLARREFGLSAFGKAAPDDAPALHSVLGFATQEELSETYKRYRSNLLSDIREGKTPDKYLRAGR